MNCKKCGFPLDNGDVFCKNCGEKVINEEPVSSPVENTVSAVTPAFNPTAPSAPVENTVSAVTPAFNPTAPSAPVENTVSAVTPAFNPTAPVEQSTFNPGVQNQSPAFNPMNQVNSTSNNGQAFNNGNVQSYGQLSNNSKGFNKNILIGIICAVVFVGVFLFVFNMFNGGNNDLTTTENSGSSLTQTNASNYKVLFKGFTLSIPDDYVYEEDNGVLLVGDEAGTWVAQLEIEEGSFSQLKANKSQLPEVMKKNGYTSSIATMQTLGGVEFITLEIKASGQNAIAALAKANSMYFFGITALNNNNEYDYTLLNKVAPIISSAKLSDSSSNYISSSKKININGIKDLAK